MTIENTRLIEILHEITADLPSGRAAGCGKITDLAGALTAREASLAARVLALVAAREKDAECQEAELNAISDLATYNSISRGDLVDLSAIVPIEPSAVDAAQYLRDENLLD
ncbi:MAG: hypothetical protein ACQSGP_10315 [Frankia sp.]